VALWHLVAFSSCANWYKWIRATSKEFGCCGKETTVIPYRNEGDQGRTDSWKLEGCQIVCFGTTIGQQGAPVINVARLGAPVTGDPKSRLREQKQRASAT